MLVKLNKLNHMSYHGPPVLWMATNGILVMEFLFNVPNDMSPLLATRALENNLWNLGKKLLPVRPKRLTRKKKKQKVGQNLDVCALDLLPFLHKWVLFIGTSP